MPVNFTLRLLSAARHAYAIMDEGPVPPKGSGPNETGTAPPASDCVGYVTAPYGYLVGQNNEDAGFAATIPEGIVVSIRGTTPPSRLLNDPGQVIVDWARDAALVLQVAAGQPPGFPGQVHSGFYSSFMRLWDKLGPKVAELVAANPGLPLYVIGHSKGGAVAPLVAWRLHIDFPNLPIIVRTFAPARVGDQTFAAHYNAAIPDHIRYEFDDDLVPHLPLDPGLITIPFLPKLAQLKVNAIPFNYGEVGVLAYIQANGSIVPNSAALSQQRVINICGKLATFQLGYIVDCHGTDDPARGYAGAHYPPP